MQGTFSSIVKGMRGAGSASADLYAWRARRFVALDEIGEGQRLDAVAKSVTGEEKITVRGLFRDQIEVPVTWTVLGQGNKEPECDPNDPDFQQTCRDALGLEEPRAENGKRAFSDEVVLEGIRKPLPELVIKRKIY